MPRYDLRCDKCGNTLKDKHCKMDEVITCPCGKKMQRVPTGGSFQLKGQGWYRDGYGGNQ